MSAETKTINKRFILRQLLGQGATSAVYRATDDLLEREVSVKIYRDSVSAWTELDRRNFVKEAKLAASLSHPNLAAIYSVGITEACPFIVMELVDGKTLASHLATEGAMPVQQALDVIEQVCSAAQYLHENGLVHRDIKPSNIMLSKDGDRLVARLIDLGLAKKQISTAQLTQKQAVTQTSPGLMVGTPSYMSPEQVCGDKVDQRSDVFALGAVLYEAVTATRAFDCEQPMAAAFTALHSQPKPMCETYPGMVIPPAVENAVLKALSKHPNDRYQSAAMFGAQLASIKRALILGTTIPNIDKASPSSYRSEQNQVRRFSNKSKRIIAIVASGIAIASTCVAIRLSTNKFDRASAIAQVSNFGVSRNDPRWFVTHCRLQELAFDEWKRSLDDCFAKNVLQEGGVCLSLPEAKNQSLACVRIILRSAISSGKSFSNAEIDDLSNKAIDGIKQNDGSAKRKELRTEFDEIYSVLEKSQSRKDSHTAYRIFLPVVNFDIAAGKPKEALAAALQLLGLEQRIDPGSGAEAGADSAVSLAYYCNQDFAKAQTYLNAARAILRKPRPNELTNAEISSLWLSCASLEQALHTSSAKPELAMAMKYAKDNKTRANIFWTELGFTGNEPLPLSENTAKNIIALNRGNSAEETESRGLAEVDLAVLYERRKAADAPTLYEAGIRDLSAIKNRSPMIEGFLTLARCNLAFRLNQTDLHRAEALLSAPTGQCTQTVLRHFGLVDLAVGEHALEEKHTEKSKYLLDNALQLISPERDPIQYCQTYVALTQWNSEQGNKAEAVKAWNKAELLKKQLGKSFPAWLGQRMEIIKTRLVRDNWLL
jgi:serine/threonine protein kinase